MHCLAINKIEKNTSMCQSYKFYYVGKIFWNSVQFSCSFVSDNL